MAAIANWAGTLSEHMLKIGGSGAILLTAMVVGSHSTTQTMMTPLLAPAWFAVGVSPEYAAIASSHLAMGGQGLPPADVNTFAVAGLVSGILGKTVDPMKSMIYCTFTYCWYLVAVGFLFLYL